MINNLESELQEFVDTSPSNSFQPSPRRNYDEYIQEVGRQARNKILLAEAKHEIYQSQYREFSLEETARTEGVAGCIAVLVLEEDRYTLGHFSALDLNPLDIDSSFTKMIKEIYDRRRGNFEGIKIYVVGGTTYTEQSYPTMASDESLSASIKRMNEITAKNREDVERVISYIRPPPKYLAPNDKEEEKVSIDWLEPDTCADIGYCKGTFYDGLALQNGNRVVIQKRPYPEITDPRQLEMLRAC